MTKCVYSVLGINMEGQKEILGTWISENESASFYASICSDLRNRGVSDIFIACHDNLTGLYDAINAAFSKTKNQLCIVRQIRNSCKFVPYKDRKYPNILKSWDRNWSELTTFFEYPPEIRKITDMFDNPTLAYQIGDVSRQFD